MKPYSIRHPLIRMMLVFAITGIVDAVTVWFAPHPLPWAIGIACSVPISTSLFVILPMLRKAEPRTT